MKKIQMMVFMVLVAFTGTVKTMDSYDYNERTPLMIGCTADDCGYGGVTEAYNQLADAEDAILSSELQQPVVVIEAVVSEPMSDFFEPEPVPKTFPGFVNRRENAYIKREEEKAKALHLENLGWGLENKFNAIKAAYKLKRGHLSTNALNSVYDSVNKVSYILQTHAARLVKNPVERRLVKQAYDKVNRKIDEVHALLQQGKTGKTWSGRRQESNISAINDAILELEATEYELDNLIRMFA